MAEYDFEQRSGELLHAVDPRDCIERALVNGSKLVKKANDRIATLVRVVRFRGMRRWVCYANARNANNGINKATRTVKESEELAPRYEYKIQPAG